MFEYIQENCNLTNEYSSILLKFPTTSLTLYCLPLCLSFIEDGEGVKKGSALSSFLFALITLGYFHNLGQCNEPYGGTIISMNKHRHHTTTSGLTRTKSRLKQYDNKSMVIALVLVNM